MLKKFEDLTTAADLLTYIKAHGRPTDIKSICRMQDIIGHTAVNHLIDITQENTSHMMPLLLDIWNWEDATNFYNKHINVEYRDTRKALKDITADCISWKERAEDLEKVSQSHMADWCKAEAEKKDLQAEAEEQKKRADAAEAEVMKLKAMLFDYMMKAGA